MPIFIVKISKEAGVYIADIEIKAKNQNEAEKKAMNLADNDKVDWEYVDDDFGDRLIQVEEVERI